MGQLWAFALFVLALFAWARYAQHPTARNLRTAIAATLDI
jgi:hypothetical protein